MPSDWLQKRFDAAAQRSGEYERKAKLDRKAEAGFPEMFGALKTQIEEDLRIYNEHETLHGRPRCKCTLTPQAKGGFRIYREVYPLATLEILRTGGATAQYTIVRQESRDAKQERASGEIEIISDENGELYYKHKGETITDVSRVSQIVLTLVICE